MARTTGTTKPNAFRGGVDLLSDAEAWEQVLQIAREHTQAPVERPEVGGGRIAAQEVGCYVKSLPQRLIGKAAKLAAHVNPANRTPFEAIDLPPGVIPPMALTILVSKYWGPEAEEMSVSFMEDVPSNLKDRILEHMNAWSERIGKTFVETNGSGLVRISLEQDGFWSYLGTDVALIPQHEPTMSLQDFSMRTPESEYKRVIRHETGHTLGFPHEHMRSEVVARIDRQKAFDFFRRTQGWDEETVEQQVLTPLNEIDVLGTPADQDSIMCYHLPGSITKDGKPILGGLDINETDYDFAEVLYPQTSAGVHSRRGRKVESVRGGRAAGRTGRTQDRWAAQDWGEENDVDLTRYGLA